MLANFLCELTLSALRGSCKYTVGTTPNISIMEYRGVRILGAWIIHRHMWAVFGTIQNVRIILDVHISGVSVRQGSTVIQYLKC